MLRHLRGVTLTIITILVLGMLVGFASLAPQTVQAQQKGPASDELIYQAVPLEHVPDAIGKTIDVYIFGLRPAQTKALQGRTDVNMYPAPAGMVNIDVNPAPVYTTTLDGVLTKEEAAAKLGVSPVAITYMEVNETKKKTYVELGAYPGKGINPFAFREVRFALNYLLDRDYIVTNIYSGYAAPMFSLYSFYDPQYAIIADIVAKYKFTYAPALADDMISKVLTAVGAKKEGGTWVYDGKPIKIKFIIRTEDERKDIGDLLATELERLGFTVDRMYMEFGEAINIVYASNPADLKWHLYTAGWGKSGISKWGVVWLNQQAPWYGWLLAGPQPGYWMYKNATMDELSQKLLLGQFKSKEEYMEMHRRAAEINLVEAVRIWVVTTMDAFPAVTTLKGVTQDLGAGLRSIFDAREWYIPGKSTVRVGHLHVWTASTVWNPYGGFIDIYSEDLRWQTTDPFDWVHPFSGEPIPFRVTWEVTTAGPEGKLDVPSDAIMWDAATKKWVNVEPGTKATSKVVFDLSKLIGTKWHNGVTITWADVLATWTEWSEIAYDPEKSQLESTIAGPQKQWEDKVKGIRLLPDENKLEVYVDYWHFDSNYIADYAILNVLHPAELMIIQDYLAFVEKKYALSQPRSMAEKIEQLSLVLPEHAKAVKEVAEKWLSEGYFPSNMFTVNGKSYMTKEEWESRLKALINWVDTYGNAWISNGPFKIVLFDKDKDMCKMEAFRDPTYPFSPGTWFFGLPKPVKITEVGVPAVAPGDSATITVSVTGEPPIHVKYILRDPVANAIITTGEAEQVTPTSYRIVLPADITGTLKEYSAYELIVLAFSEKVAMPSEVTKTLTTGAALSKKFEEISKRFEEVGKSIEEISSRVEEISSTVSAKIAEISEALGEALKTSMSELSNSLTTSLTKLSDTLSSALGTVSSDVSDVKSTVSDLSSKMDELSDKVSTLESSVKGVTGSFTTLQVLLIVVIILQIIAIVVGLRRK